MGAPPQIDTHAQVTFDERLRMQAQQMDTKTRGTVSEEELDGEKRYFDNYGAGTMVERLTRGQANTPQELPRARRAITPRDFEYTEEFDMQKDQVRVRRAIKSDSNFEKAIVAAMARQIDDVIIEAMHGNALTGKEGQTVVAYDATNQEGASLTALTTANVREARRELKGADVDTMDLFALVHPDQLDNLLGEDPTSAATTTSIDYNAIKALVEGEFTRWVGFTWVQSTRVTDGGNGVTAAHRWATFYARDAVIFGTHPGSFTSEWEKLPGRGKTWQYALYGTMAATRQFENKIYRFEVNV